MKKVFIQMSSPIFDNNGVFTNPNKNHLLDYWHLLKEKLINIGYELTTADNKNLDNCERIIFNDYTSLGEPQNLLNKIKNAIKKIVKIKIYQDGPTRKIYKESINAKLRHKILFIIWEGKSVCPSNFYKSTWNKFNKILTWDDNLVDNKKFFKFFMPAPPHKNHENIIPWEHKKLLVNISFNKYSSYKAELYSERRRAITYFDKHYPNDFDLYGPRWNMPITRLQIMFPWIVKKYSTYRGSTDNKQETLSKYKFALAYENNGDADGYITEKMFDCLYAKVIPIYLGAPNILNYVPENVFIDRRKFKNNSDLSRFLEQMTEIEYNRYIEAGQQYLKSEQFKKFSPEFFCEIVLKMLDLKPTI